ncbi:MAG: NYN domain-containing protein [Candidatus Brocadiaceae bacterium]
MVSHTIYENTAQRVGIFVDVQNMFYSAKALYQSKIDYRKLLEMITHGRKLVRAIAYVVQKADVDQSSFLEALRRSGYEVKTKELTIREDGSTKGDWKMEIGLDALTLEPRLDCAVVVSGDGDFVPLVHALNARGCRTEVVSFEQSTSNELMRDCGQFISIEPDVLFKEEKFVRQAREQRYADADDGEDVVTEYPHSYSMDN